MKSIWWYLFCVVIVSGGWLVAAELPATKLINPARLQEVKTAVESGSTAYEPALKKLRRDAEKALAMRPVSVMEKKQTPPSGDKHDYMSMGKYWWPDPSKPDGKPYLRRDGEVNPETDEITDHDNFGRLASAVETLGLAHYFFGGEDFAKRAAELVRVWFVDPATRMNPNLNFAQAVPGREEGRGAGIIDLRGITRLLDGLGLIETSGSWTGKEKQSMQGWVSEYIRWLRESKNGKQEASAKNNHGTWYDVQLVSLALYAGDKKLARDIVSEACTKRIGAQIRPDGSQPEELARTRSWGYSSMNLEAFFALATLAERVDVELWKYAAPGGGSIRRALENLYAYASGEKKWETKEIRKFDPTLLVDVFRKAATVFSETRYTELEARLATPEGKARRGIILYPEFGH